MSAGDRIRAATAGQGDAAPAPPFRRPSGRASYPRRVTLDLDDERYEFMRRAAWDNRVAIAELLRSSIDLLRDDPAVLDRIAAAAGAGAPPEPAAKSSGRAGKVNR